jgi:HK97 family phage major capsid protein
MATLSFGEFYGTAVEGRSWGPLPHQDPGNTRNGKHAYSLLRAIESATQAGRPPGRVDGLEGEVDSELRKRYPDRTPRGFWVPVLGDVESEERALDSTTGAGAVRTIVPDLGVVDALRARTVLGSLGARVLSLPRDQGGKVKLPRRGTAAAVGWTAEGAGAPEANPTIDAVTLTPKTVSAKVAVTRRLLKSAFERDHERRVLADIATGIGVEIDRVGLVGDGVGKPTGLLNTGGVNSVAIGANGGAATRAVLVELERLVGVANGDAPADVSLGWIGSPNVRAAMRKIADGSASWLWSDAERVVGKPAYATTNVPSNLTKGSGTNLSPLLFGNWRDCVVNLFTPVDLLVDPYKQSTDGVVQVSAFQDVDVAFLHLLSFGVVGDVATG